MYNNGAPRANGAPYLKKFGNLSVREILSPRDRTPSRPFAPQGNQCEMSNFLASAEPTLEPVTRV